MYPSLSIITPSYNQGDFIEETILSVLDQDIEKLEYIICDGGSSDQTLDILRQYEHRLAWISEHDNGQSEAINKGIAQSKGEIIGWINSDDLYYPGAFKNVLAFFESHPEADFLYGKANYISQNGDFLEIYPTQEWDYHALCGRCFICQPAVFFRRKLWEKFGPLDESLKYCLDYELWLRYSKSSNVCYYEQVLSAFRLHKNTKTLSQRIQAHDELNEMMKTRLGYVPDIHVIRLALVKTEQEIGYISKHKIHHRKLPLRSGRFWFKLITHTIFEFWRFKKFPSITNLTKILLCEKKKYV